jgi:hypothetical protein
VYFRYDHILGTFDYRVLRPVHAALSTTAHSLGLISSHMWLFLVAIPTYTPDYRNGDPMIQYLTELV